MTIVLGWDIAQTTDNSIVALLTYDGNPAQFWVRQIVKLPRGMPYDQQVKTVRELVFQYQNAKLIIDRTGVGLPICDAIVAAGLQPVQVALTSGDVVGRPEPGKINLPKKDMVASITKVLQERRLKVVAGCENAALFRNELKNFQLKVSASGYNTYNAAPGQHDDTITAVGLCLWYGDKGIGTYGHVRFCAYTSRRNRDEHSGR
ncbi:MAG: hypothetical protein WC455_21895 [Dehalococcoidia bacterium]|jgi:hypothetical protein